MSNTPAGLTVLVVSPHFDDEMIGCGGAVLRHLENGDQIYFLYVSAGDAGDTRHGLDKDETRRIRQAEAKAVMKEVGVRGFRCLEQPEGFVTADSETLRAVIRYVRDIRPDIIYGPHRNDGHPDHRAVAELTTNAARTSGSPHFPDLGERHKATSVRYYEIWTPLSEPNLVIDISRVRARKAELLGMYASQVGSVDYVAAIEGLNRYRGILSGNCAAAEAFVEERVRPVVLADQE